MRSSPSTYEVITCSSRQLTRRAFLGSCRFVPSEGRGGRNDEGGHPKGPPRLLTRQEESSGVAPLVQDSHFPHDRWTGDRGSNAPQLPNARTATGWGPLLQGAGPRSAVAGRRPHGAGPRPTLPLMTRRPRAQMMSAPRTLSRGKLFPD